MLWILGFGYKNKEERNATLSLCLLASIVTCLTVYYNRIETLYIQTDQR